MTNATVVQRFIRAIPRKEEFTWADEDSLERLLQKRFADNRAPLNPDGSKPLQSSLSLYCITAEVTQDGQVVIPQAILAEVNALHSATAPLNEPNSYFLDVTDFIGERDCPQKDTNTPFPALNQIHHSLPFDDEDDLRNWVRHICQSGAQFHEADWDETQGYVHRVVQSGPLSPEWAQAQSNLRTNFQAASPQRQRKNFAFWIGAGLLP